MWLHLQFSTLYVTMFKKRSDTAAKSLHTDILEWTAKPLLSNVWPPLATNVPKIHTQHIWCFIHIRYTIWSETSHFVKTRMNCHTPNQYLCSLACSPNLPPACVYAVCLFLVCAGLCSPQIPFPWSYHDWPIHCAHQQLAPWFTRSQPKSTQVHSSSFLLSSMFFVTSTCHAFCLVRVVSITFYFAQSFCTYTYLFWISRTVFGQGIVVDAPPFS